MITDVNENVKDHYILNTDGDRLTQRNDVMSSETPMINNDDIVTKRNKIDNINTNDNSNKNILTDFEIRKGSARSRKASSAANQDKIITLHNRWGHPSINRENERRNKIRNNYWIKLELQ
jgi:hypothetical protein